MKFTFFLVILFMNCGIGIASKVLFVFPTPSRSHMIVVQGLSKALAEKGHEVTVVSPFPMSKFMKNYRDIKSPVSDNDDEMKKDLMNSTGSTFIINMPMMLDLITDTTEELLKMSEFKKIMKEEKFDLVIIGFFYNNYLLGLGDHFKCPTIILSVQGPFGITNNIVGNSQEVSAVPHQVIFQPGRMSFMKRVANFLINGADMASTKFMDNQERKLYEKYFPSDRYRSFDESKRNVSLVFVNSHFSQGFVRPLVPAMVEVGGLQVKPSPDPLPTNLKIFLDGAKKGAIFLSFGSNAKSTYLPKEKVEMLLKVFTRLKERIVIVWESETLEGKPDNVMIGKWLPQDDILAHPNVKLFVTHGGLGSIVESMYHGVPIVGTPIFGDQIPNVEIVVSNGWGVKVDFKSMNETLLYDGIRKVLDEPSYASTVKKMSQLYRDRPMNARETAVFWVEYVIRHHGAPHLQYPAVHLNFWQKCSLDVIAFLIVVVYVAFKVFVCLVKLIVTKMCRKSSKAKTEKKRN